MANINSPMTGFMAKYNANDCVLQIGGKVISGFGEDTMITVSRDQDRANITQDPQGTGILSVNNKDLSTITVNISEVSPDAKYLSNLCENLNEFPIDLRTTTFHYWGSYCLVIKDPDYSVGAQASNLAFQIKAVNLNKESVR